MGMKTPELSIIVIAHNMRRQASNTVQSLSIQCQKNVSESDYEIIVVENESSNNLDEKQLKAYGGNIHYYSRKEPGKSPVHAINFALSVAKGSLIGLLIDGARMVTSRVVEYALMALRAKSNSLIAIPGYFIGPCEHHYADDYNYSEDQEIKLLESIQWQKNPYRLFNICTISAANPRGAFIPFLECNCFFTSMKNFKSIGGADEKFLLPGGGALNLHTYRKIALLPDCTHYFIAQGEGSFHQLHGGVTTSTKKDRDALLKEFSMQLNSTWGEKFRSLHREPILLGAIPSQAQRFLAYSARRGHRRFTILSEQHTDFWPDDKPFHRYTEQSS